MKYLVGDQIINGDHIVMAKHNGDFVQVVLSSVTAGKFDTCATGDVVTLYGDEAKTFWAAYSADAVSTVEQTMSESVIHGLFNDVFDTLECPIGTPLTYHAECVMEELKSLRQSVQTAKHAV